MEHKESFFCEKCGTSFTGTRSEKNAFKKAHFLKSKRNPRMKVCANLYETVNGTIARPEVTILLGTTKRGKDRENETFDACWDKD